MNKFYKQTKNDQIKKDYLFINLFSFILRGETNYLI